MGRNKQDSSRNFRSWNKIISVLRARVIFVFFYKKSRNRTLKKLQNHTFLSIFRCQASFIALDFIFLSKPEKV
jgi:prolipoprotein diacylglyceryltransferase